MALGFICENIGIKTKANPSFNAPRESQKKFK
jgi:hypothetical protein